jgi:cell division protein FtsX
MINLPADPSQTLLFVGLLALYPALGCFLVAAVNEKRRRRLSNVFGWIAAGAMIAALVIVGIYGLLFLGNLNARADTVKAQVERQYHISLSTDQAAQLRDKRIVKLNDGTRVQLIFHGEHRAELKRVRYESLR